MKRGSALRSCGEGQVRAGAVTAGGDGGGEGRGETEGGGCVFEGGGEVVLGREAVIDGEDAPAGVEGEQAAERVVGIEITGDHAAAVEPDENSVAAAVEAGVDGRVDGLHRDRSERASIAGAEGSVTVADLGCSRRRKTEGAQFFEVGEAVGVEFRHSLFGEGGHDEAVEVGVGLPGLGGDDAVVADGLARVPGAAGMLHFEADVLIAGDAAVRDEAGGDEDLDAVADGEHPLAGGVEGLDEIEEGGVVAEVLGRASADEEDGIEAIGAGLGDGEIGGEAVAWAFDVGIPAGFEVVHDEVETPHGGSGDDGFIARLLEAVDGIEGFVGFAGVTGDNENASGHDPCCIADGRRDAGACAGGWAGYN